MAPTNKKRTAASLIPVLKSTSLLTNLFNTETKAVYIHTFLLATHIFQNLNIHIDRNLLDEVAKLLDTMKVNYVITGLMFITCPH